MKHLTLRKLQNINQRAQALRQRTVEYDGDFLLNLSDENLDDIYDEISFALAAIRQADRILDDIRTKLNTVFTT